MCIQIATQTKIMTTQQHKCVLKQQHK